MGKMTKQEIQGVVDLFVEYIGDADICGERAILDSRAFPPEQLRDKINKARDAVLHYKQAADTGDYSGGIRVDLVLDDLLHHTVKNPPAKGSPEYKILWRKAADALKDKWEAYQVHHTKRLAGVFNAVSDGTMLPQQVEPVDEGQLLSEVIKMYADEKYTDGKKKKGGWTAKSREEIVDGSLGLFKEIVGDIPIQRIEKKRLSRSSGALSFCHRT